MRRFANQQSADKRLTAAASGGVRRIAFISAAVCPDSSGARRSKYVRVTAFNSNGNGAKTFGFGLTGVTPNKPGWWCFASYYAGNATHAASSEATSKTSAGSKPSALA